MRLYQLVCIAVLILLTAVPQFKATDTLPERLSDENFWKLVESLSEKDGQFFSDNFLSNESRYPDAVSSAQKEGTYARLSP